MLLLLLRRVDEMIIALFISFLACVIFCRLSMVPWWGYILGTLLVYGLIFTCQVVLHDKAWTRRQRQKEQKLYSSDYEVVTVDPQAFTWLDLDYYDTKQRELESLGFEKIRDHESLSHTRAFPEIRFFSRTFNNVHYEISAEVLQVRIIKPKNVFEKMVDIRLVIFGTEFSDGTFLETTNGLDVNPVQDCEGIIIQQFPPNTSLETLLDIHENKVERICETKYLEVILHRNAEEVYAAGKREFLLLCKDRQKKYDGL
jgi:hypothetical protein